MYVTFCCRGGTCTSQNLWASDTLLKMIHQLHATVDHQMFTLDESYHRQFVYEVIRIICRPDKSGDIHPAYFLSVLVIFCENNYSAL